MTNLCSVVGIGEVYRVQSQIALLHELSEKYGFHEIYEYPVEPIASLFPIPWKQTDSAAIQGDLLFTWRCFTKTVNEMLEFKGSYLLLMATNRMNMGVFFQKFLWKTPEVYLTLHGLKVFVKGLGEILESGYYDCPLWIDAPLPSRSAHFVLSEKSVVKLLKFEHLPLQSLRGHHVYCLIKKEE